MPRRNRVDPWGDLHATAERGSLTGNRGCLVDDAHDVVRHHRGNLWISCLTSFRGWRHPLDEPGRWTPLFFLDDAVALAAGHRPCGLCRRDAHQSYVAAVSAALGRDHPIRADELNRRLASERLRRGSGLDRRDDRRLWTSPIGELPIGTVIVGSSGQARLLLADRTVAFSFGGWVAPEARPEDADVRVITPPTSVAALRHGFQPLLHLSASC